jgi:hypothetical protein
MNKYVTVPADVRLAIARLAEQEPSDPFVAARLLTHYRTGIWSPADVKLKASS